MNVVAVVVLLSTRSHSYYHHHNKQHRDRGLLRISFVLAGRQLFHLVDRTAMMVDDVVVKFLSVFCNSVDESFKCAIP